MPILSSVLCVPFLIDALIVILVTMFTFANFVSGLAAFTGITLWILLITMAFLYFKGFYNGKNSSIKDLYRLFEAVALSTVVAGIPILIMSFNMLTFILLTINAAGIFSGVLIFRTIYLICKKYFNPVKNVLIVGAGQDGKLIAEEIQARPDLRMKVVGFLDDNMNNIEDEDSSIPILGLTCDTEAVIKDNNVQLVIIAVKSRMDSAILTDLVKGIPLGVKVWRMPKFYEKITRKYLVSKMTVNWLFYDCVRKKALLYAYLKRICDVIASILIIVITIPLSLIAVIGIKLSDFGPIFFSQTRMGKFGKPFKMLKFRTMYQDEVDDDFDDDLNEINADDKRIMPFCRLLRKFHIDELPQMINVLKGEMSIIGPRPVREEVYYENKKKVPFWESRNWVRPGWCGWQQVNICEPEAEERLRYDLYYIKHRNLLWEFMILVEYVIKVFTGRCK